MSKLTKITELNEEINTVCKGFFKENEITYSHLYRNPFVKNSKRLVSNNIDGRSIKYYGCTLNEKLQNELNSLLLKYNVKCINLEGDYFLSADSVRIVNL